MSDPIILLTGANGRTGRAILDAMVKQGLNVRAFIRRPDQADELKAIGASEIAIGDFTDKKSIDAAVKGVEKILHIGSPMDPDEIEVSSRFIDAATKDGVAHFIYYSVMHPLRREVRHHRFKLDVEEQLIESGLAYTIVQPSRYMQHLVPIWIRIREDGVHAMPFNIERKFNIVDLRDLAAACALIASEDRHLYATYELAGPQALSQIEMAEIISDVLGMLVRAEAVTPDALTQKARAVGASDDKLEQMLIMNAHYDAHGFRGNSNILEYILGRPATRFRSYVKALAASDT